MSDRFRLTRRAETDLIDIAEFTLRRWGAAQSERYVTQLFSRFSWLSEQPQAGAARDDVLAGARCFPEDSHLVFYRVGENGIEILAVPHGAMDLETHFGRRDPDEEPPF